MNSKLLGIAQDIIANTDESDAEEAFWAACDEHDLTKAERWDLEHILIAEGFLS